MASPDEIPWETLWKKDNPSFHEDRKSLLLVAHLDLLLDGRKNIKIFFPMCGKSLDMKWMYDLGHTVVGVELVERPIKLFFSENGLEAEVEDVPAVKGKLYKTKDGRIKLYCCSMFDFSKDIEGEYDAIFDSGGYEAMKRSDRTKHADILVSLMSNSCRCLMHTFEFEKRDEHDGLPSDVDDYTLEEVKEAFTSRNCVIEVVDAIPCDWGGPGALERLLFIRKKV